MKIYCLFSQKNSLGIGDLKVVSDTRLLFGVLRASLALNLAFFTVGIVVVGSLLEN